MQGRDSAQTHGVDVSIMGLMQQQEESPMTEHRISPLVIANLLRTTRTSWEGLGMAATRLPPATASMVLLALPGMARQSSNEHPEVRAGWARAFAGQSPELPV